MGKLMMERRSRRKERRISFGRTKLKKERKMEKLGVTIYFGDLEKAKQNLKNLVSAGYRAVYFDSDFLNVPSLEQLREVKRMVDDLPLEPFSIHNLQLFPEPEKKPESIISFQEEIFEKANLLGVKYLTGHFGWCKGMGEGDDFDFENFLKRNNMKLDDYRKKNIETLKVLCQKANAYGLSLTIENLPIGCLADLDTTVENLLEIIRQVDEPNSGICFDSGHSFISGLNLYNEIIKAGGELVETHFHDNIGRISDKNSINDMHQPAGIGKINWFEVIAALKKINFSHPVVFEIGCDKETLRINRDNWLRFFNLYQTKFSKWDFGQEYKQ